MQGTDRLDLTRGACHVDVGVGTEIVRLTIRQLFALRIVSRTSTGEGLSLGACARRLGVGKQTVRNVMRRLVLLGLITKTTRRLPNGGQLANAYELTLRGLGVLHVASEIEIVGGKEETDARPRPEGAASVDASRPVRTRTCLDSPSPRRERGRT